MKKQSCIVRRLSTTDQSLSLKGPKAVAKIVFLSTDNLEGFFVYDTLLIPFFEQAGWQVATLSWHNKDINWSDYDYVIVRSTWDYQQYPSEFTACLESIDKSKAKLLNPLTLIKWNIEKSYLLDLKDRGVSTVPTFWQSHFSVDTLVQQFDVFATDTLIIKPILSANADDAYKVSRDNITQFIPTLSRCFAERKHMIQPFLPSIVEEGEYSLFYFAGAFSHSIRKVPKSGDFRVQEEHGGALHLIEPDQTMLDAALRALDAMPEQALYARVDLVRCKGEWALMELELIEPSLYFNLSPSSPQKFVDAFLAMHQQDALNP